MKQMLSALLGALFVFVLLPVSNAAAADAAELKIATEAGYAPFEYRNPQGDLIGFDIDIGNELCRRLQRQCVWVDQSFDSLIPGLRARKFDLAASTMTITAARQKAIDFTVPLYFVPMKLLVKKGSGLEPTAESLKGKRIGVQQGTTLETYAREAWEPTGTKVISYPDYTIAYTDLLSGRLDATFQQSAAAVSGFLDKPEGKDYELARMTLDAPILNQPIGMGMRKNNELKPAVDAALTAMLKDGTIENFARKYFAEGNILFPQP